MKRNEKLFFRIQTLFKFGGYSQKLNWRLARGSKEEKKLLNYYKLYKENDQTMMKHDSFTLQIVVFCCSYGVRVGRTDFNSADPHLITSRTDHILRPSLRYIHTGQSQSKNFGHHFYPKNYACFRSKIDGLKGRNWTVLTVASAFI